MKLFSCCAHALDHLTLQTFVKCCLKLLVFFNFKMTLTDSNRKITKKKKKILSSIFFYSKRHTAYISVYKTKII